MTATSSSLDTRRGQGTLQLIRRLALAVRSLFAAIHSRWSAIVEAGQLGPDVERSISRHTGARI
jgi:hypothetical protein